MPEGTIALTIMTLLLLLIFGGMFVWGVRTGQFHNVEEAKFRMFRRSQSERETQKREKRSAGGGPDGE